MKVTILASGSSGNATLFESGGTRVLVDAGIGPRALGDKLRRAGVSAMPDAIVVTHAHADHLGHCDRLSRGLRIPVYASEATARAAHVCDPRLLKTFRAREAFQLGAFTVAPLPLPHDAAQVCLRFSDGTHSAAIATDLGEVPPALPEHLRDCDVLLIESNHDPDMLETGPYPRYLKTRIASARGHLSNQQTNALLRALPDRAHTVVLMHLSRTNNTPGAALEVARDALSGRRARLIAAVQDDCTTLDASAARPEEAIEGSGARVSGVVAAVGSAKSKQLALPF